MASKSREIELSESLLDLQVNYNKVLSERDFWKEKADDRIIEIDDLNDGYQNDLKERDKEIEELKRLLDGSKNLVESMIERAKPRAKRNAKTA